jgi:hypothetical protein
VFHLHHQRLQKIVCLIQWRIKSIIQLRLFLLLIFPKQGVSEESEKIFVGTLSQDKKRWIIKVIVQVGKESISTYALIR